jgi:hypothetical protein
MGDRAGRVHAGRDHEERPDGQHPGVGEAGEAALSRSAQSV